MAALSKKRQTQTFMKSLAFLLMAIGMLFSCKSDEIGPKPVERIIKYKGLMALPKGGLTFTKLLDYRCPNGPGLFCFSAGAAEVDLQYNSSRDPSQDKLVQLCLGSCGREKINPETGKSDATRVNLDGTNYLITLTEVNPYPKILPPISEKDKKDYVIKLKIQTAP